VDNVKASNVTLAVGDDTDTTSVTTTGDHGNVTNLKLDELVELAGLQVELDGVVDLDQGIRVAEGAAIVGDDEGDALGAELDLLDLAQLVLGLLGGDTVDSEASLGIVDETEVLTSLLDGDDIHETSRVGRVSADLAVDLDEALHEDGLNLLAVEGVLQTVAQQDDERQALAELMGTGAWSGGLDHHEHISIADVSIESRTLTVLMIKDPDKRLWMRAANSSFKMLVV